MSIQRNVTLTPIKKRFVVKKRKDELLNGITDQQKHGIRLLLHKFNQDYQDVVRKRGTKSFDVQRWMKANVK